MHELKIAQVITRLDWGGSPDIVRIMCVRLAAMGHDVTLISGPTAHPTEKTAGFLKNFRGRFIEVPGLRRDIGPANDIAALTGLCGIFRREKFDIIHTHTSKAGFLGRIAARIAGCRAVVHTPHGHIFYGYFGRFYTKILMAAETFASSFSDKVIALTELEKKDMVKFRICPAAKIEVVRQGLELDSYSFSGIDRRKARTSFGFSENDKVIGMVGRLETVKGPEYFVEAASFIARKWPESNFIMAGDGSLKDKLVARVKELGLEKRFVFAGWIDDVPQVLSTLDILIMPSLNEAVGMAAVEAEAAGVPVIASNVGGIPEAVRDGDTAILVAPREPRAIADIAYILLSDPEKRRAMAEAGRSWARGNFRAEVMVRRVEGLYMRLLAVNSKP